MNLSEASIVYTSYISLQANLKKIKSFVNNCNFIECRTISDPASINNRTVNLFDISNKYTKYQIIIGVLNVLTVNNFSSISPIEENRNQL